ncbi:cytidylyltransferase domain-containing protein [Paenibacillus popilliae]|uniref:Spore coat polysaccharide biosynthesis protein F n=1 Tax=Paenibacillus popilliae ATCC 14706 TaxID=1212764 RepID=M9LYT0_PAEPP|nr:glycosyltransferase family protein [Paenibacillus popilliae]GAC41334.1 spore coat polysaccharide biosynthesis protein F [Paenibacillus popilliae ATCC 14706]
MRLVTIIQARMGSTRLPGKVMLPLGDTIVLDYVVNRCRRIKGVDEVVVATSTERADDKIEQWCKEHHIPCSRGPQDDVLARYYQCAQEWEADTIFRVTSDCPFVDYNMASHIVDEMQRSAYDIIKVEGQLPRGLVAELFSFRTLDYMNKHGVEARHREHVTYYAYEHPDQFHTGYFFADKNLQHPQLRMTLDTAEDYKLCQWIAQHFTSDLVTPSSEVISYLLEHPEIAAINAHVEQKRVI